MLSAPSILRSVSIVSVSVVLAACGSTDSTAMSGGNADDAAAAGTEASALESNVESLGASFVGSGADASNALAIPIAALAKPGLPGAHVQALGDAAKAFFQPSGCLAVTADAASAHVSYVFDDCTGPYGLVHLTGTATIDYTLPNPSTAVFSYAATGFQVNGATVDWRATATIAWSGDNREMKWNGDLSGTTKSGRAFTRTNNKDYQWTVGQDCLAVSGQSDGTISGKQLTITLNGYNVCAGECPAAGSEVTIDDVTDSATFDLTYGDGTATYTGPRGDKITFKPICAD